MTNKEHDADDDNIEVLLLLLLQLIPVYNHIITLKYYKNYKLIQDKVYKTSYRSMQR